MYCLTTSSNSKPLNPQTRLYKAWLLQKKIIAIRKERDALEQQVVQYQQQAKVFETERLQSVAVIQDCQSKEESLDDRVSHYAKILRQTQERMANGIIMDEQLGNEQCAALNEKIDHLETEYFVVVEEREAHEKQIFLLKQKTLLLNRNIQEVSQQQQEKEPLWFREEEDLEEHLEKILSKVQPSHQQHFDRYRFTHPKLVAQMRNQFCGGCSTKLPLRIAGEIETTSNVHICSSCKAFCIA